MVSRIGRQVGAWRLLDLLGAGGMGEVWRAEGAGGSVAAVKIVHAAGVEADWRFEREARALMAFSHDNVVRALDCGVSESGRWMAMELLEGESLEERLVQGPLPAEEVVDIGRQAAAGLAVAHGAGLVHRDIKPGNLFLCRTGCVKVLDFGLAIESPADSEPVVTRLTGVSVVVGTPDYMAPEQARGSRDEDARTDVWGLAATLFHALAGSPPFAAQRPLATLVRIVTDDPDPLPPHVPAGLRVALGRALAKQPAARFPTMASFAESLHAEGGAVALPVRLDDETRLCALALFEGVRDVRRVIDEIGRCGGRHAPLRGGRVVGIFGDTRWTGDEPHRALRAALAAVGFARRAAVGTGRAAGTRTPAVEGTAVERAETALAAVRDGAVGADAETLRQVLGSFEVRGQHVIGERRDTPTGGAHEPAGDGTPLRGREEELGRLRRLIDRVIGEQRAGAALIVGPPGVGKSRLLREVQAWVEARPDHIRVVEAHCDAGRGAALGALAAGLRRSARLPEGTGAEEALERVRALVEEARLDADRVDGTVEFLVELLGPSLSASAHVASARAAPEIMRDRIRLAVGDLFEGWSAQGPVLVVLDDAQWSDALTIEYLDFLLLRLEARSLCVLATARPEGAERVTGCLPSVERVELRELSSVDIAALVEAVLGRPDAALAERAGGNPMFAEQLALASRQGVAVDRLPLAIEGAVQARLDALPADDKELVKRASVLGKRFWIEALEAAGAREPLRGLTALRRREIVLPRSDSALAGCREWWFRHDIVCDVARAMLTDEQARALHRAAAEWLSARRDAPSDEVAEHLRRAGRWDEAVPWLLRAVEADAARGDAVRVLALSADLLGRVAPATEHALRLRRADALLWLDRYADAERELTSAVALEHEAAPASRADGRRMASLIASLTGRDTEAAVRAQEAVRIASASGDAAAEVRTRARLAIVHAYGGRHVDAKREADRAQALAAATGDARIQVFAHGAIASAAHMRGDHAAALSGDAAMAEACSAAGEVRQVVRATVSLAAALLALGDFAAARRRLDAALADARRLGLRVIEGFALQNLGLVLHRIGETSEGLRALEQALDIARAIGNARLVVVSECYRAVVLAEAGDVATALLAAESALAEPSLGALAPVARACRALAWLAAGREADALAEADRALAERAGMGGMEELEVELLLCRRDALDRLGRAAEAGAALDDTLAAVKGRLDSIGDPGLRATSARQVPAHARAIALGEARAR